MMNTLKNITIAKNKLSKRINVDPQYLDFIGVQDYGIDGGILYYFNVSDVNHIYYESTKVERID